MDKCANGVCNNSAWQATIPSFLRNINHELKSISNSSLVIRERAPKTLTNEAIFMIFMLTSFIALAVIGTAITAFEFLSETIPKKNFTDIDRRNTRDKISVKVEEKASQNSDFQAWLRNCKSFFQCFCTFRNGRKILNTVPPEGHLPWMDGIRVFASVWVIHSHLWWYVFEALGTEETVSVLAKMWSSQLTMNGFFAMDLFFVLGGFLNGYLFFNTYYKSKGNINWVQYYVKRLVRITPGYMVVLGFYATLFPYIGSGPLWPTYDTNPVCKESWWWNLLYINNFKHYEEQCMLSTWYLACDMQLYFVSPLFLVSLLKWPKFGYVLTGMGIFGSSFASFMITKNYGLVDGMSRIGYHSADTESYMYRFWEYFEKVYDKPYIRISSYLVGLALGYYLYEKKVSKDHTKSTVTLLSGWIMTAIGMWICIFSFYQREENIIETAIYNGGKFVLVSCCFAWIIYACFTGQGGFLGRFFSSKVFSPLSTVSYCAYLTNIMFITAYFQSMEDQQDISITATELLFCRQLFYSYMAASVVSLFVEHPMLNLYSFFTKTKKEKTKKVL